MLNSVDGRTIPDHGLHVPSGKRYGLSFEKHFASQLHVPQHTAGRIFVSPGIFTGFV